MVSIVVAVGLFKPTALGAVIPYCTESVKLLCPKTPLAEYGAGSLKFRVYALLPLRLVVLSSLAVIEIVKMPPAAGVPDNTPLLERERPAGKDVPLPTL